MDGKLRLLPAAILVGLICACSGGNAASPGATTSPSPTPRQVSQADLPNMVLTSGDLGAAYSGFVLDSAKSGPKTRDDRIKDACDPQKQATELDQTRWVAGYDNEYDPASGASSTSDGSTFLLSSGVDLFQDASGSALALPEMIADTLQWANTECHGVNVGAVQEFEVPTIGDKSWGSEATLTIPSGNRNYYGVLTIVAFQQGPAIVNVDILRFGGAGAAAEAIRLAKALAQHTS